MDVTPSWAPAWARVLPLVLAALGLGGCMCSLPELALEPGYDPGCIIGELCPDGSCVADLLGSIDGCCGFGGECTPCPGPWGGVECPDGTCALWAEACCMQGGACDPGDSDGPSRTPTAGDSSSDGTSTSEGSTGDSTAATDDPSGDTSGESGSGSTDEATTGDTDTDTGESPQAPGSTSGGETSSTG